MKEIDRSVAVAYDIFPELYWKVLKDLGRQYTSRNIKYTRDKIRRDAVELIWILVGSHCLKIQSNALRTSYFEVLSRWTWPEEVAMDIEISHYVNMQMEIEAYTENELEEQRAYFYQP